MPIIKTLQITMILFDMFLLSFLLKLNSMYCQIDLNNFLKNTNEKRINYA
jgi:hypothetical protein